MSQTFLWHDYETWGADPRRDRACQFAAVRTDVDLNEVGEPVAFYCQPAADMLPHPEACLVTGITPQLALRDGLIEAQFAERIQSLFSVPGTCGVGYNSMRFDDEVTRHLLYRNFFDPYAREWQNGNSRWDLIDTLRLAHALRPEGIRWPVNDDGTTSFRLESLTAANGIGHGQAHDALADVRATIAMAKCLRAAQPKLLDYALTLRDKRRVRDLLGKGAPLIHASARFPAALGCIAPIIPVAPHPTNGNGVICFDLRNDPTPLLDLTADELRQRLFTPAAELPQGAERIALKTVHVNRSPVLAPMATLGADAAERWSLDPSLVAGRTRWIQGRGSELVERVQAAHQAPDGPAETDPDLMLYSGGFFSDKDRRAMEEVHRLSPHDLASRPPRFEDPRLPRMLFRYRARNWPETLTPNEAEEWDSERLFRLTDPSGGASIQVDAFGERLEALAEENAADPRRLELLEALSDWAEMVLDASN